MTDIAAYMHLGGPCIENNAKCRTMDAASGCACAQAADEIDHLRAEIERLESVMEPWRNLAKLLEGDVATLRATNERLRADLAHADAKGQENDKLLWGTIKANERLRAALRDIADDPFSDLEGLRRFARTTLAEEKQ